MCDDAQQTPNCACGQPAHPLYNGRCEDCWISGCASARPGVEPVSWLTEWKNRKHGSPHAIMGGAGSNDTHRWHRRSGKPQT